LYHDSSPVGDLDLRLTGFEWVYGRTIPLFQIAAEMEKWR
jgi:hypothetical protein